MNLINEKQTAAMETGEDSHHVLAALERAHARRDAAAVHLPRYLLTVQITYNRRMASNKNLAFNARDLQQRLLDEFNDMKIWDVAGEDHSATALAIDKRRALEENEAEEDEGDE